MHRLPLRTHLIFILRLVLEAVSLRCRKYLQLSDLNVLGWLYTIWSILMALSGIMIIIVLLKGEGWRKSVEQHEAHPNNGN